jgi:predicted O-methyltransferase YrrM
MVLDGRKAEAHADYGAVIDKLSEIHSLPCTEYSVDWSGGRWEELVGYLSSCLAGEFAREMHCKRRITESTGTTPMFDCCVLYALVRLCKPLRIVETGSNRGMSTAFLRKAQQDSGIEEKASVITIDICSNPERGMLIPPSLKPGVTEVTGSALDPAILGNIPNEIDFYYHDSIHRLPYQTDEYSAYWRKLRSGGLLVSHDVDLSLAFSAFVAQTYVHDERGYVDRMQTRHHDWGRIGRVGFLVKK